MFDRGVIMKGAFYDDSDWMSTLRASVTPEEAYRRWTEVEGYLSIGTYAVRVGHARAEGLTCVDDAEQLTVADHASVVFEDLPTPGAKRRVSKTLRDLATDRGALFAPTLDQ